MADSPLTRKLGIKPGHRLLIVNAPEGYREKLVPLPEGVKMYITAEGGTFDFILLFVKSKADVDIHALHAVEALKPGGLLWLAYPKKTSGITTDVSRDEGWDTLKNAHYEGVSLIAIDETWSATRFRPSAEVKSRAKAESFKNSDDLRSG